MFSHQPFGLLICNFTGLFVEPRHTMTSEPMKSQARIEMYEESLTNNETH